MPRKKRTAMNALGVSLSVLGYLGMLAGVACLWVVSGTYVIGPTLQGRPISVILDPTLPLTGVILIGVGFVTFALGRAATTGTA